MGIVIFVFSCPLVSLKGCRIIAGIESHIDSGASHRPILLGPITPFLFKVLGFPISGTEFPFAVPGSTTPGD
jgi:hypothetical protein